MFPRQAIFRLNTQMYFENSFSINLKENLPHSHTLGPEYDPFEFVLEFYLQFCTRFPKRK
jgi:hypothetical protein